MDDSLDAFSTPVRDWFADTFGSPTPPQQRGWSPIARGEHTLLLAPTGSGKTLAAFLWGIDRLARAADSGREEGAVATETSERPGRGSGVRIVYVSPLKALNNDIYRNLRQPLQGVRKRAAELGVSLPEIRVAVRSGDTPARERRSLVNRPPDILITTPESLYLLLTGPKARMMFPTVETVIVDEIHTMAGSKRGVHLSLSLERLGRLARGRVQRIGLSATIRPLDEVARFLGGYEPAVGSPTGGAPAGGLRERPVTIVDAAYGKPLDLAVETVTEEGMQLPGGSVWPVIVPRLAELVRDHRTTLVFANNRRLAERTADRLSEELAGPTGPASGFRPGSRLLEDGVPKGLGNAAAGRGDHSEPVRAHHGSMSKEVRLRLEQDLKAGNLRALVGTSSLELGIDIGSVDLVVQLQAPKGVASGLQRVGRSGHLVGQTSKGRIFPTHREDLVEAAAVAGGMLVGEVEHIHTPRRALDVLAQQIVAMVSVEDWEVDHLRDLVRRSYPYRDLTEKSFRGVLEMLAGRYSSESHGGLRPRIAWDRVNDRLTALPGSRMLALTNGGTIPDTGTYGAYLPDLKTRIGDLDEEFVFETRVGDTFMLGSQVWRVLDITEDRVVVGEAPGAFARMPFWHGDQPWRQYELGKRVGRLRREVSEAVGKIAAELEMDDPREIRDRWDEAPAASLIDRLRGDFALDLASARRLVSYVAGQDARGALATDGRVVVELFDDDLGDHRLVVHSPFGGRVNGPWSIVLADALRERTGAGVEVQANDDGILLRFPESEAEFPDDLVERMGPEEARIRLLRDLPNTPVFGARFRQNAARALMLPGLRGGRRTPFWLQRLRARDLLQAVRGHPDFPLIAETFRDCLEDVMDLPGLLDVLRRIDTGAIQLAVVETVTPSPVAQGLLWTFANQYLYEWDAPRGDRPTGGPVFEPELLSDLLHGVDVGRLLRPEAVDEVAGRLRHTRPGTKARSAEELMLILEETGDLREEEIEARSAGDPRPWLDRLWSQGRVTRISLPGGGDGPPAARRCGGGGHVDAWIPAELLPEYEVALAGGSGEPGGPFIGRSRSSDRPQSSDDRESRREECRIRILDRALATRAPVTPREVADRYDFSPAWVEEQFERRVSGGEAVRAKLGPGGTQAYARAETVERMYRTTLKGLRGEIRPVSYESYAAFLLDHQHASARRQLSGHGGLRTVLQQLRGYELPADVWERDALPARLDDYAEGDLEVLARNGEVIWVARGAPEGGRAGVRFFFRGEAAAHLEDPLDPGSLGEAAVGIHGLLASEGALFLGEIATGLGLDPAEVELGLSKLARAALVTNDSLAAMYRALGPPGRAGGSGESSLERQLRDRRAERGPSAQRVSRTRPAAPQQGVTAGGPPRGVPGFSRPRRSAYRAASRRVRERLGIDAVRESFLREGRWALVHRLGVVGPEVSPEEAARRQARQLLSRWGVVTRRHSEWESSRRDWSAVSVALDRMEIRGEVRRGYFVRGLPGRQYAHTEVVEALAGARSSRSPESDVAGEGSSLAAVVLNATDPAQAHGAAAPEGVELRGEAGRPISFARVPSTWLVYVRGVPVLVAEDSGSRISVVAGHEERDVREGLVSLAAHLLGRLSRVAVETWNGFPVLETPGRGLLEDAGFYRDRNRMTRERSGL